MKVIYILLLSAFTTMVKAQDNSIKGRITSENISEDLFAVVKIKETNKQVEADKKGNFEIHNLKPGTYTLYFSALGFSNQEKTVELH